MGVVFDFFAQLVNIKVGDRDFRTHQNDQLTAHVRGRRVPEKCTDVRQSIQNRDAFDILLLTVSDQTTQNDCGSTGSGNICSYITRGDVWNRVAIDNRLAGEADELVQYIERPFYFGDDHRNN